MLISLNGKLAWNRPWLRWRSYERMGGVHARCRCHRVALYVTTLKGTAAVHANSRPSSTKHPRGGPLSVDHAVACGKDSERQQALELGRKPSLQWRALRGHTCFSCRHSLRAAPFPPVPSAWKGSACRRRNREVFVRGGSQGPLEPADEPEATVLLVACGIGLATGAGVVAFNDVIHWTRHLAYPVQPVESTIWGLWARNLTFQSSLLLIALPPTVGGLAVGLLRCVSGGFADQPPGSPLRSPASNRQALSLVDRLRGLGKPSQERRLPQDAAMQDTMQKSTYAGEMTAGRIEEDAPKPAEALGQEVLITNGVGARGKPGVALLGIEARSKIRAALAPFLRAVAAAITLGSGCSLGPEGPSVEIGRAAARGLGRVLRSKQRRLLPLIAAGSGAGVAAGFNAPISGVFFAVESVLQQEPRTSEAEERNSSGLTVAMILLASVVAALVSQAGLGNTPAFRVPEYQLQSLWELPLVLVLGSACGLVSVSFSYLSEVSIKAFKQLNPEGSQEPLLWVMLPCLGGACTGIVALAYPEVLYQGFGNVNAILASRGVDYAPGLLLQMLGAKVLTTAVCRGSGLVGGIYAPSIFMGAALGSAFGGLAGLVLSPAGLTVAAPAAYALVGVAGMLAANCQVPLTAVLLLFELTHDYFIILPTLAAVGLSYWTASLPIVAGIRARLQATSGPDVGAGALTSVDGSQLLPGDKSLIRSIQVEALLRRKGSQPNSRREQSKVVGPSSAVESSAAADPAIVGRIAATASMSSLGQPGKSLDQQLENRLGGSSPEGSLVMTASIRQPALVEGLATAAAVQAARDLTAQCAVESACVMVSLDTPLTQALLLLDEAEQSAALVLDSSMCVTGILTRGRILEALAAEAECRLPQEEGDKLEGDCTVELVVGMSKSK